MSQPSNIPVLPLPEEVPADAAEVARCQVDAANLVEDFSRKSAMDALESLLAAADGETPSTQGALDLAEAATERAETLHGEVARFLSLTRTG